MIADRIASGESCAIVTDAGMPAISDPGEDLVALCHEREIPVRAVPGPTAFATAVALSGLPTGRFTFEGFLSMNKNARKEHLRELRDERRTMIFYEAPHKLPKTLKDLYEALGDRRIAIIREITKIYEEVIRINLAEAAEKYSEEGLRGEIVLVVEGKTVTEEAEITLDDAVSLARVYVNEGLAASMAAKKAAKETGFKKGDIYKYLTEDETTEE